MCHEGLALHQRFQTFHNIGCGRRQHLADNIIASGGLPERFGTTLVIEIANYRPRIKNLRPTKAIAVVPVAQLGIFFAGTVVFSHLLHFIGSKAEIFTVPVIQNGIDLQIIQSTENTLLCNP